MASSRITRMGGSSSSSNAERTQIYVGNLSWEARHYTLRTYFAQFGEILEAFIITNKNTGRSKGCGFVTFSEAESALRALEDPYHKINGRIAHCKFAASRTDQLQAPIAPQFETLGSKIIVRGLVWQTWYETMLSYFTQFGDILEAVVVTDNNTGRSRGCGFITFKDGESASKVLLVPNHVIDGRTTSCSLVGCKTSQPQVSGVSYEYYCLNCKELTISIGERCICSEKRHIVVTKKDFESNKGKSGITLLRFEQRNFSDGDCIITCDAAWYSACKIAGYGISVRDWMLNFIEVRGFRIKEFDSNFTSTDAEILALFRAIYVVMSYRKSDAESNIQSDLNLKRYRIFTDCKPVAEAFNQGYLDYEENGQIKKVNLKRINECRKLAGLKLWDCEQPKLPRKRAPENVFITVEYVERERNFLADLLSRVSNDISVVVYAELPEYLKKAIHEDFWGIYRFRAKKH